MSFANSRRKINGLTLVETMISFAIIGIATVSIAIPLVAESRQLSRRMTCQANLRQWGCLLYTSPSPRDATLSRMPSSA